MLTVAHVHPWLNTNRKIGRVETFMLHDTYTNRVAHDFTKSQF